MIDNDLTIIEDSNKFFLEVILLLFYSTRFNDD